MEEELNERQPRWKTTLMEDNLKGRRPQWKTTSIEDNLYGRLPQLKTTKSNLFYLHLYEINIYVFSILPI